MFCGKNLKIQNGRHFWRDKFLLKTGMATLKRFPVDQNFRQNRYIYHGLRDISIFVFCIFCEKNLKIQNGLHFWRDKFFLKIGMATLKRSPVAQKFHRNCSISHGFQDISIFVFCNFCEKFENSKWPPFLVR